MALNKKHSALLCTTFLIAFPFNVQALDNEMTAQQKYDALAEKGIFSGVNGEALITNQMNRAQYARVVALISGLEQTSRNQENYEEPAFSDVEASQWYLDTVAAAMAYNLIDQGEHGTFGSRNSSDLFQYQAIVSKLLGDEEPSRSFVPEGDEWRAKFYVANIDFGAADSQPAGSDVAATDRVDAITAGGGASNALASFDKSLLKTGYSAQLNATGGTTPAVAFYEDQPKNSAAVFSPLASDDAALRLIPPGAATGGDDRKFTANGVELTVMSGCTSCGAWPVDVGLTFGSYAVNPGNAEADYSYWLLGPEITANDFGALGADARYTGSVLAYRMETGQPTASVQGGFTADYFFLTQTGSYAIAIGSEPTIEGSFTATDGKVTGSGSTGMTSAISGAFGTDQAAGDLLFGSFWAGSTALGYEGIFASVKTGLPPDIGGGDGGDGDNGGGGDGGGGGGNNGGPGGLAWQIPADRVSSEYTMVATGYISSTKIFNDLIVEAIPNATTLEAFLGLDLGGTPVIWTEGTQTEKEGVITEVSFEEGIFYGSTGAICAQGCGNMSWGEWESDAQTDFGYWITADTSTVDELTAGAEFVGVALGFHGGDRFDGTFIATVNEFADQIDYTISDVWTSDLVGSIGFNGSLSAFSFHDSDHTLNGAFTDDGAAMFGSFGFDKEFDEGDFAGFVGTGIFGAGLVP